MNKLKIYINKEILNRLKEELISLDYAGTIIAILMCLYEENFELLDEMDDANKSRRLLLLYRYLIRRGMIEETDSEDDEVVPLYKLTEKGISFIQFVYSFDEDQVEVRKEMVKEILGTEQKIEEWIGDWINLFPEGKFAGRSLRTNSRDCLDRMRWFMKNYSYSKEEIFQATQNYISAQETSPTGHQFTRNTTYFICKGTGTSRTSDLLSECERLKEQTNTVYEQRDII